MYMIDGHPLPWLAPLLNGVEHANFFETRATEYSKAATRGNWNEVWDNFDKRKSAKAANDVPAGRLMRICLRRRAWRLIGRAPSATKASELADCWLACRANILRSISL
jgi:hypothetical protein